MTRKLAILGLSLLVWSIGLGQSFDSSNLPILVIETNGKVIPDEPKIIADFKLIDNGGKKRNALTDQPAYAGKIGIELRGSSSQSFPKKPYGFELRDATGEKGVNASLLGMPEEEDWVLNATYNDKTLIREVLTYDLYRSYSSVYSPRQKFCEVMLNGNYQGIYLLFEKIKRDKNRVAISKLEPKDSSGDDLTGGYILKIDKFTGSTTGGWKSPIPTISGKPVNLPIQVEYPKDDDLTAPQLDYIRKYVTEFEQALKGPNFRDAATGYAKYINVDSWVDYMIINEVTHNIDGYRLSTFFHKDKDSKGGKLTMGPIWDYNLSFGNADYCNGESPQGWTFDFNRVCPNDGYQIPFWWERLLQDPEFAIKVRVRYQSLRQGVLKTDRITQYIDSTANVLKEARVRNFTRWPVIGKKIWPNFYVGSTYQEEIDYLKSWTSRHLEWIDREIVTFGVPVTATEAEIVPFAFKVFPNPARENVQVSFNLDRAADVKVQVYDLWGRVLRETVLGELAAGNHAYPQALPESESGVQFLGLQVNGERAVVKRVLRE